MADKPKDDAKQEGPAGQSLVDYVNKDKQGRTSAETRLLPYAKAGRNVNRLLETLGRVIVGDMIELGGISWGHLDSLIQGLFTDGSFETIVFSESVSGLDAAGPTLLNEAATATNPTIIPDRAQPTTGIGLNASNDLVIITDGATVASFDINDTKLGASVITIGSDAFSANFFINGPSGRRGFRIQTAGVDRWAFRTNQDVEAGVNAGSNLEFFASADNGSDIGVALELTRATLAAVVGGTLAWGGGAAIASSDDVRSDHAGIRFDGNAASMTIDLVDLYHLVTDWDVDGPEVVSNADQANNQIVFGDTRVYQIMFATESDIAGAPATFVFDAFAISQTTAAITAISEATPAVVTASGHGLSNGNYVKITGVVGMVEVNDHIFKVAGVSGATFELTDDEDVDIASGGYTSWSSGGTTALATKTGAHTDRAYTNGSVGGATGVFLYSATSGDAVELYVKNETNANDLTIEGAQFTIVKV